MQTPDLAPKCRHLAVSRHTKQLTASFDNQKGLGMARIVVFGTTGSGKSTLAEVMASRFGLRPIELDGLFWGAGWTPVTPQTFRERAELATRGDNWIAAGNYSVVRDIVWGREAVFVRLCRVHFSRNWRRIDIGVLRSVPNRPRSRRHERIMVDVPLHSPTLLTEARDRASLRRATKGSAMSRIVFAFTLMMLTGCATDFAQTPAAQSHATAANVADWEKWRADENAAWSKNEFAILKIDDAIYLNDGESAWLGTRRQKELQHKWNLGRPRGSGHFVITFERGKATVFDTRKLQDFSLEKPQTVRLRDGIDVRFALTQVNPGVNGLRVMVYNQGHPLARDFLGLEHFPYNPSSVVEARIEASASAEGVDFQTSRGWLKRINRVGFAHFSLEGKQVKLGVFSDESDPKKIKQLSAFFLDELSGKETYGVGRYIDIDVEGMPERLTIDFNRAYNPNCARSPHYNCPFAVEKIPVELRAGEKIPPKH